MFSLILLENVLLKTNILSKYLQSPTLNYGLVSQMVKKTINNFEELKQKSIFKKYGQKLPLFQKIMVLVKLKYHGKYKCH